MLRLTFTQIPADLIEFNYFNAWSSPSQRTQRNKSKFQVLAIAILGVMGIRFFTEKWDWSLSGIILGSAIFYVLTMNWFVKRRVKRHIDLVMKKSPNAKIVGERTWVVSDTGIEVLLDGGTQIFTWKQVAKVEESTSHWMMYLDNKEALVLPKRALSTREDMSTWKAYMDQVSNRSQATPE